MHKMTAVRPPVALRYDITLHWPRPCTDADIYVEVIIECHRCFPGSTPGGALVSDAWLAPPTSAAVAEFRCQPPS